MAEKYYADLADLAKWAEWRMDFSKPNFTIQHGDLVYLRRWWIIPRNHFQNVYLHEILVSDDARALHDHPWDNTSFLIAGGYTEVMPSGDQIPRVPGDIVHRKATDAHRLIIPEGGRAISLFLTGPMVREWGFHCPKGWRHWKEFVELDANATSSNIGRGCED